MAKIKEITQYLESIAPASLQESYDNSRLMVGDPNQEVTAAVICLDITEEILEEAQRKGANLIIAHHPLIFNGLKKLTGENMIERCVMRAIKKDIALYAIHTNLDNIYSGVNYKIANCLELSNLEILAPKAGNLLKITVFIPNEHVQKVTSSMHDAGAGNVGNYKECSFRLEGTGTFLPGEESNPFSGEYGKLQYESETRVEMLLPDYAKKSVLQAMTEAHPYEEVAYFLHRLENKNQETGAGMIGELKEEMSVEEFLQYLKEKMELDVLKYTKAYSGTVRKIGICGGSGAFLIPDAINRSLDVFITGDVKYHDFFIPENKMLLVDIGHFESEKFTIHLLKEILSKKFTNFALYLTEVQTNPIKYYQ